MVAKRTVAMAENLLMAELLRAHDLELDGLLGRASYGADVAQAQKRGVSQPLRHFAQNKSNTS